MQSSFAFIVSFKFPASRFAQDDILVVGVGNGFGFSLDASAPLSGGSESTTGAASSVAPSWVGEGASIVHDARNSAPTRYLIASSRVPTDQ